MRIDKNKNPALTGFLALVVLLVLILFAPPGAMAQQRVVRVAVSSGQLIDFPRAARSVFIADPSIADIQVPAKNSVIVFGRKPGQTTLFAIDDQDKLLASIQIIVGYDLAEAERLVRQDVSAPIELTSTPTGVIMSGTVPDASTADKVRTAIQRYLGEKEEVVNQLRVTGPSQVNLRVRIAEIARTVTKQLGFNWEAIVNPGSFSFGLDTGNRGFLPFGGSPAAALANPPLSVNGLLLAPTALGNASATPNQSFINLNTGRATVNNLIDALAEEGLVTILAEPNLTATSGQTASFLAGGEFPIPVAQTGATAGSSPTITVEFKQYGVSLDFVPTVLSSDRISIRVRPEVSELTTAGGFPIPGFTTVIPALNVRRAETTVELGSGQSFAIAGLIQNNSSNDINKYPGLGDVPILGTLFRSSSFQRNETELVIIVTPYIVRPVSDGPSLKLPTDGFAPASDVERIFLDQINKASPSNGSTDALGVGGPRLHGDAGFIIE
jgi:pilus assembly protein CpaC